MRSPTTFASSNLSAIDSVQTCVHDLRALLERRVGDVDACEVYVEGHGAGQPPVFRITLNISFGTGDLRITASPQTDVYIALRSVFDQAMRVIPPLRRMSSASPRVHASRWREGWKKKALPPEGVGEWGTS